MNIEEPVLKIFLKLLKAKKPYNIKKILILPVEELAKIVLREECQTCENKTQTQMVRGKEDLLC